MKYETQTSSQLREELHLWFLLKHVGVMMLSEPVAEVIANLLSANECTEDAKIAALLLIHAAYVLHALYKANQDRKLIASVESAEFAGLKNSGTFRPVDSDSIAANHAMK